MHTIMSTDKYAETFECNPESVARMCRDGTIKNKEKVGGKWFIDCTMEHPKLFPDEPRAVERTVRVERTPIITADMRLGDALAVLLDALAGKEIANES